MPFVLYMDEPIVVMGICGSYDLDSANGRMLELILRECGNLGAKTSKKWQFLQMPMSSRVQNITEP